jgi:glycosyltransferase involved in cell wall biosynthesis
MILEKLFRKREFLRLVVISEGMKREFMKIFPYLPAEKILVAHDGADLAGSQSLMQIGRKSHLQVGYLGSLYQGRGIEIIVALAGQLPEIDFHIFGGEKAQVQILKEKNQDIKNLYFHGYIEPAKGESCRQAMDILLAPYQESVAVGGNKGNTVKWMSPLKIFEYMASGRAIVASDLPAIREILTPDVDALLVSAQDTAAWKNAILRLLDLNFRYRLANKAQEEFKGHYTWSARANKVLEGLF